LDQPHRPVLDVLNLESHPDLPVRQMSDLDFIDHPTLRRVSQLERRPTGVENHDTRVAAPLIGRLFWQPQCVPVEPNRGFVILDLDDDSQLKNWAISSYSTHQLPFLSRSRSRDAFHLRLSGRRRAVPRLRRSDHPTIVTHQPSP
jgi:hypothetical protein